MTLSSEIVARVQAVEAKLTELDPILHDFCARRGFTFSSHVGVWLSPFGGYPCREYRMKYGCKLGFETYGAYGSGLTLAGPRYFARVLAACQGMIDQFDVNYFKFDGFGAGNSQLGALDRASDVEALLDVIARLRRNKPDVFINPSTGSWPSPFWLRYADSLWRQGDDMGFAGRRPVRHGQRG